MMRADAVRASPSCQRVSAVTCASAAVPVPGPSCWRVTSFPASPPRPLLPPPESLFSIILIWNFIMLIWISVLQTSGGPPGSLLASTCYSAGTLCSRLGSGPAVRSRPGAHTRTAHAATPLLPPPRRRGLPGPRAPKRSQDGGAQASAPRTGAAFTFG